MTYLGTLAIQTRRHPAYLMTKILKINHIKSLRLQMAPNETSSVLAPTLVSCIFAVELVQYGFAVLVVLFADLLDDAPKTPCEVNENKE